MEKSNTIPLYIEAPNKKMLVQRMLNNNMKNGSFFRYFDIQKDGDMWVAWYFANIKIDIDVKEVDNG